MVSVESVQKKLSKFACNQTNVLEPTQSITDSQNGDGNEAIATLVVNNTEYTIYKGIIATIGRQVSNRIVIKDLNVSKCHGLIRELNQTISIMDLKSRNGIFLNKKRLVPNKWHELKNETSLKIGTVDATFRKLISQEQSVSKVSTVSSSKEIIASSLEVEMVDTDNCSSGSGISESNTTVSNIKPTGKQAGSPFKETLKRKTDVITENSVQKPLSGSGGSSEDSSEARTRALMNEPDNNPPSNLANNDDVKDFKLEKRGRPKKMTNDSSNKRRVSKRIASKSLDSLDLYPGGLKTRRFSRRLPDLKDSIKKKSSFSKTSLNKKNTSMVNKSKVTERKKTPARERKKKEVNVPESAKMDNPSAGSSLVSLIEAPGDDSSRLNTSISTKETETQAEERDDPEWMTLFLRFVAYAMKLMESRRRGESDREFQARYTDYRKKAIDSAAMETNAHLFKWERH